jgi:hypothetical protein
MVGLLVIGIIAGSLPLMALDGQIVTVTGKVEAQDASGTWKAARAGDPITAGTMISTGFKSEATVKLGASILTVKPLTRMTLTQLVEKEDTVNTDVYLEVGNVKAEVNSLNNKKNGFTVKSPVATASVRGTVFEIGDNLVVIEGNVAFATPVGQIRNASAGERLELVGSAVTSPAVALQAQMETIKLSTTPSTEVTSPIAATSSAPAQAAPEITASSPAPATETTLVLTLE